MDYVARIDLSIHFPPLLTPSKPFSLAYRIKLSINYCTKPSNAKER